MMFLNIIVGGFLTLLLLSMLWTCVRVLRKNNMAVAAEPFVCPRCGHTELTIHATAVH
jgi:hypothetical protein